MELFFFKFTIEDLDNIDDYLSSEFIRDMNRYYVNNNLQFIDYTAL